MYKLTNTKAITRLSDMASIPADPANTDYQEYLEWVALGNTPEPVDPLTKDELKHRINATCQRLILAMFSMIYQMNVANGLYADKGMKQWIADMVIESNRCNALIELSQEPVPAWPIYTEVV